MYTCLFVFHLSLYFTFFCNYVLLSFMFSEFILLESESESSSTSLWSIHWRIVLDERVIRNGVIDGGKNGYVFITNKQHKQTPSFCHSYPRFHSSHSDYTEWISWIYLRRSKTKPLDYYNIVFYSSSPRL